MEIFQTIWNALISENELLVKIICLPLTFLEIYLIMLIFLNTLNIPATRTQKITYVLSFSFVSILSMNFLVAPYYNFINIISMPILVFFIFKTTLLKSILAEIVTYITGFIVITPLVLLYSFILNVPAVATNIVPIHKICFSLVYYLLLYIINMLYVKFNINISLIDKFKNTGTFLLVLNFIIGCIAIFIEYFLLFSYINLIPFILTAACMLVLLFYFIISMFSLVRTNKLEITTQNLEEQKMYNKTLSTLHDNIRGFKHDFDNIVQAIGGYLSTNNIEGLKIYYTDVLGDCQTNNTLAVLNPELINNPAIYSLLVDKYYKAEELGIKMNIEVMMDLSNLNIKIYELSRILGVLFDNALEAASKYDKKIINITFRKDKNRHKDLIIIQNTYANKDIDINRIFEKGFSSKDENAKEHGLGLWEVKRYLKKNNHLDLFTTKADEFFTQQFEIYYE